MADISKFKPFGSSGSEYNIKDATARTGKADKVSGATSGNFAGLDANGNLTDSGKKASDFVSSSSLGSAAYKDVPTSGNASTSQVVMGNDTRLSDARNAADVSAWAKASTKPTYTASEVGAIATTAKGANNGVAELDSSGKVPASQLPSYVDDVVEYSSKSAFPATGESSKIYIATDTNLEYRWSGTAYVEISPSLALGETSSTAYAGNKGKANADNIATIQGLIPSTATTSNKLATEADIPSTSNFVQKSSTSGLLKNDGTVDTTAYAPSANAYQTGDTAETALADGDYFPFYDTSATAKRKTLWSNIKSVLKTYFDTLYSTVKTRGTPTSGGTTLSLVNTGDMYTWNNKVDSAYLQMVGSATQYTYAVQAFKRADGGSSETEYYVNGSFYMEQTATLSTSGTTTVVFQGSTNVLKSNCSYEVFAGRTGGDVSSGPNVFNYSNIYYETTTVDGNTVGRVHVTFPQSSSAIQIKVRLYIKTIDL